MRGLKGKKRQKSRSRGGSWTLPALVFLCGAGLTALGAYYLWNMEEQRTQQNVERTLSDSARIWTAYYRGEIDLLSSDIISLATRRLDAAVVQKPHELIGLIETDPTLLDVSLWRNSDPFDSTVTNNQPRLIYRGLNGRYSDVQPNLVNELQVAEIEEKNHVSGMFTRRGQTGPSVFVTPHRFGNKDFVTILVSLKEGNSIALGHVRIERFQRTFYSSSIATGYLVDSQGGLLAQSKQPFRRGRLTNYPLYQASKSPGVLIAPTLFSDTDGTRFFGWFTSLEPGNLKLLLSLPEEPELSGRSRAIILISAYLTLALLIFSWLAYLVSAWSSSGLGEHSSLGKSDSDDISADASAPPKKADVTVLYLSIGSLATVPQESRASDLLWSRIVENIGPEQLVEVINDVMTIVASAVKEYGGVFDRYAERSFVGVWGASETTGSEAWSALKCALTLRKDLASFNEARKIDGHPPLLFGISVHSGVATVARLQPENRSRFWFGGEVLAAVKALNQLVLPMKKDLLVSQTSWQASEGKFAGELISDVRLTQDSGLVSIFSITGYQNEVGEMIDADPVPLFLSESEAVVEGVEASAESFQMEKKPNRWLVNNGSQIIGPLTAKEIARKLFEQELDFDCECWTEGTGTSALLRTAGIFSGSGDVGASLWMYDGEIIHGPISSGFLKTALGHGAIQTEAYYCDGSTVDGWKPVSSYNFDSAESRQDPLKLSIAPPALEGSSAKVIESTQRDSSESSKRDSSESSKRDSSGSSQHDSSGSSQHDSSESIQQDSDPSKKVA